MSCRSLPGAPEVGQASARAAIFRGRVGKNAMEFGVRVPYVWW